MGEQLNNLLGFTSNLKKIYQNGILFFFRRKLKNRKEASLIEQGNATNKIVVAVSDKRESIDSVKGAIRKYPSL